MFFLILASSFSSQRRSGPVCVKLGRRPCPESSGVEPRVSPSLALAITLESDPLNALLRSNWKETTFKKNSQLPAPFSLATAVLMPMTSWRPGWWASRVMAKAGSRGSRWEDFFTSKRWACAEHSKPHVFCFESFHGVTSWIGWILGCSLIGWIEEVRAWLAEAEVVSFQKIPLTFVRSAAHPQESYVSQPVAGGLSLSTIQNVEERTELPLHLPVVRWRGCLRTSLRQVLPHLSLLKWRPKANPTTQHKRMALHSLCLPQAFLPLVMTARLRL